MGRTHCFSLVQPRAGSIPYSFPPLHGEEDLEYSFLSSPHHGAWRAFPHRHLRGLQLHRPVSGVRGGLPLPTEPGLGQELCQRHQGVWGWSVSTAGLPDRLGRVGRYQTPGVTQENLASCGTNLYSSFIYSEEVHLPSPEDPGPLCLMAYSPHQLLERWASRDSHRMNRMSGNFACLLCSKTAVGPSACLAGQLPGTWSLYTRRCTSPGFPPALA